MNSEWWRRFRFLFDRRRFDRDLEEEMQFHLDMKARQAGSSAARRQFGSAALVAEDARAAWGWSWLDDLTRDLRYAARSLRRSPGFAAVASLTLALGIGVNTAMFSVLYGTCLAPLPYPDPDRLVDVSMLQVTGRRFEGGTSAPNLRDWREQSRSIEALEPQRAQHYMNLTGAGDAAEVEAWRLSSGALRVLGVPPLLGRGFVPDEDQPNGPQAALLSYSIWQRRFGGDPQVLGRRIGLDGEAYTIVGVMPPQFVFPALFPGSYSPSLWISLNRGADARNLHGWSIIGRLRPGVTVAQAQAEMNGIAARLAKAYPADNAEWPAAKVTPLRDARWVVGFRSTLWLLLGASGLVLLIACANIASLLLARGSAREREFAIRRALGVSRGRLIRQMLTESSVLAVIGCALGIAVAYAGLPLIRAMLTTGPRIEEIAIRPAVLLFAAGISALTGVLFGLLPALRAGRIDPALRIASRNSSPRQGVRKALVTIEIAAGLLLVSSAGLVLQSFWQATHVDLGFRPENVVTARVSLPRRNYDTGRRVEAFRNDWLRRVAALPGVQFVGTDTAFPMSILAWGTEFEVEGAPPSTGEKPFATFQNVSPDYLRAMGIPLLRGRHFRSEDRPGAAQVAIVSESLARNFFPDGNALGRRMQLGDKGWFTVIGVAADVRERRPEKPPEIAIYVLSSQLPEAAQGGAARTIVLAARTAGDPASLARGLRATVAAIDKDQPVADVMTMQQMVDKSLGGRRLNTLLVSLFAALALTLAAIGVFGLVSYSVSRRTNEIGIRMALGAGRATILAMIAREVLTLAAVGVVAGVAASLAASRVLESILDGMKPAAAPMLLASTGVLTAAMLAATLTAARRAMGVDPVTALRHE